MIFRRRFQKPTLLHSQVAGEMDVYVKCERCGSLCWAGFSVAKDAKFWVHGDGWRRCDECWAPLKLNVVYPNWRTVRRHMRVTRKMYRARSGQAEVSVVEPDQQVSGT